MTTGATSSAGSAYPSRKNFVDPFVGGVRVSLCNFV
jgi:hypothetical protein